MPSKETPTPRHNPNDPCNCLCQMCVSASLRRMEKIKRCMERSAECGQCELCEGHTGQHLAGYLVWGAKVRGGGEWTALRELAAKWRNEAAKGKAKAAKLKLPTQDTKELTEYDTAMEHCAAELEALAAAAPAPPPNLQVGHDESRGDLCEGNSSGLRTESPSTFSHPPQDGQGAELVGPPSSGQRSDLADPSSPSVAEAGFAYADQMRAAFKEWWDIHLRAGGYSPLDVVTNQRIKAAFYAGVSAANRPSLPEAVAGNASAPVGEKSVKDFDRAEGLYLKFSEPMMEPHTPVVIERVNGDCSVSKFIIARDEAHELINQLCEFLHVAPVGEKRQPSGVGELLAKWRNHPHDRKNWDGADEIYDDCANDLEAVMAREVGEGLREGDEVLLRAKIYHIRVAGTNPRFARDFKLMVKDGDEEHVLFVTAAALTPAPFRGDEPSCSNCGHSYAQHTKGINHPQKYCRHCPCSEWAAPAPKPASRQPQGGQHDS